MEKLRLKPALVVEGNYDKIKLSGIVDAVIITTDGFGIFTNKKKQALLRKLGAKGGIIVLTDSDNAGFRIRRFIHSIVPKEQIINCYIPDIFGKEKRKEKPSKEGKLGVEGVPDDVLRKSIESAISKTEEETDFEDGEKITKLDFYNAGLSGGDGSFILRQKLLSYYGLPEHLTTNSLIDILNRISDFEEFADAVEKIKSEN